jgi:hypothetical protein
MKPLHVGILVVVAAVGGGLVTKWRMSPNVAPVADTAPAAATPRAGTAETPTAQPAPVQSVAPAEPPRHPASVPASVKENPFPEEQPHRRGKTRPVQPRMVAQSVAPGVVRNREPEVSPAVEPVNEPAARVVPVPQDRPEPPPTSGPAEPAPAANTQPELPALPAPPVQVTLRAGTLLSAHTVEGLSSERNSEGDTFTATLDQPLAVDGWVIAERGAHLEGKIVQSRSPRRAKGSSNLAIELTQLVTSDGQRIPIETETFEKRGDSSTGRDAAKVGAGAAIGAAIGAIAGGGKGAAIGAGAGGGLGAGDVMLTRGKPAAVPAETHINFRLRNSVTITERQSRTD